MHNNRCWIFTCVIVVCCAFLLFGGIQEEPQKSEPVKSSEDSFIRMDLLSAEKKPMPPPERNIFSVRNTRAAEEFSPEAIEERMKEIRSGPNTQSENENSAPSLNLRYLGYVLSGRKTVGLVVFNGEALAVMEGELLTEGYTIGRINHEEIEILGPDSKPVMFSLEGESP